ncbi:MAG: class I SAM-dependent methyltransferase [Deltaproteobacteria bacterium]|jgi:SAM-dependent methyltransferase|nr:class I SAM-dependent methyltransferase [Deltaproteobacteria bacterium]
MTDRKTHWEKIYGDKTPQEVSWYQKEPALSLQLIRNSHLAHDAPIIDVGGGASVLVEYLCNEGYTNVAVLDISAKALAYAQDRLGDNASRVEWYEEDVILFKAPHQFSLWHDRAVFHFLTDVSDRRDYVKVLKRTLEPNGHLIIAAFAIGGPTKCSGLDIIQYDANKLIAELGEGFELAEESSEIHISPASKEQKFAYFRFIRKSESIKT